MGARYAVLTAVMAATLIVAALVPPARAEDHQSEAALRIAARREQIAMYRYVAYTAVARREAQPAAANLFATAALAEAVHLDRHLDVLAMLGDTVTLSIEIESVVLGTTAENLKAAIAGERREHEKVYEQFCDIAQAECRYEALKTFNDARCAEDTHRKLFEQALAHLKEASPANQLLACAFYDPLVALGTPVPGVANWYCTRCGCVFDTPPTTCRRCREGSRTIVRVPSGTL
jgi:rubrerythrin